MSVSTNALQVFSGSCNVPLSESICKYLGVPIAKAAIGRFPDGETRLKLNEDVRGRDVFIVQPTAPPVNDNLMELLVMIDAAKRASARRITVVIPYYGYARMDRKDEGRVPITAKLVANLLTVAGAHRVLALDLHASQIQAFFDIPVDHLYAAPLIAKAVKAHGLEHAVVAAPDAGSIKLATAYSALLSHKIALVEKRRLSPERTEVAYIIGDVKDQDVLLVDDIVATAGSTIAAANALIERGARAVYVAATHAVLCGPAVERIEASPIRQFFLSDSIPVEASRRKLGERLTVVSVAPLLGEAIRRIHNDASVSSLFNQFCD